MKLIGLTGKARSGKDTVAAFLFHVHDFTRITFADPVKLAAQQVFGLSDAQTWSELHKETVIPYWGMSPRQMFQKLGTEAMRGTFGQDVWIKRWMLAYNTLKDTDNIVVPDVRFDNEAELIRGLGGVIVEIQRGPGLVGSTGEHASEQGLSTLPDLVIENDSTVADLYVEASKILTLPPFENGGVHGDQ